MSALIGILVVMTLWLSIEAYKRLTAPGIGAQLPQIILGLENKPAAEAFIQRRILPSTPILAKRFDFLRPFSEPEKIAHKLEYAGRPYGMDAEQFLGFQVFIMIVGFILGGLYAVMGILFGACGWPIALILLPILGFFFPRFWLGRKVKQRQEAINLAMPDFLDMLVISVQAGMGFDNAMRLITRHITGPLNEEVRRLIRELDVGEPRPVSFRRLVARNTSEDLRLFIDALLQAEELGTPVAKTLEIQAAELRTRRINRAKERAARASPNISLITVFVIVPAVLCLFISMMVLAIVVGQDLGSFTP
jgi:tight adherence protein C